MPPRVREHSSESRKADRVCLRGLHVVPQLTTALISDPVQLLDLGEVVECEEHLRARERAGQVVERVEVAA